MDKFTITIIFIAVPGIICYFILSKLVGRCGKDTFERILLIFLFSILSYGLYYILFLSLFNNDADQNANEILENLFSNNEAVRFVDIVWASAASIFLAFVLSYVYNYGLLNKFGQFIRTTKRYGDEDIWYYFHNTYAKNKSEWFYVRNLKNDLAYLGYIAAYSELENQRELLMYEVSVYSNETGKYIYDIEHMYICLNKEDISIEISPNYKSQEDKNEI